MLKWALVIVVAVVVLSLFELVSVALPLALILAETCAADIAPAASWAVYWPIAFAASTAMPAFWIALVESTWYFATNACP